MSLRTPDSEELRRIYARRFEGAECYRLKVWKALADSFFSEYIAADATVLDLGCGYGEFINNIQAGRKYAMDMNPHATRLLGPNVTFFEQDCSQAWALPSDSLDVVFTSNFLEHLADKRAVTETLGEAFRCLRTDGRLIAMGPNIKYTGGAYWDFFDHHVALTELSLKEAVEIAGFRSETVIDRFLPYSMVNAPRYPVFFLKLYLKAPVLWRWFGQQFLIVVAKPN